MRIPTATYRLQFNSQFRFSDALELVDYLSDLGITAVYASPLMKARSGSVHGYDVIDPNEFNPEIGTREEFEKLSQRLHERGIGLLLDIVPNHMAASLENPWWVDLLARGESSSYANFFDIDWSTHKVFLPILGKTYGEYLESGEISLKRENGKTALHVASQELPVRVPAGEQVEGIDDLDRLVAAQPYRLAYWRKAGDEINYRRFFDVNDLVALRAERDEVFNATHATIRKLVDDQLVDGLRIDHIDGLMDPKTYLDKLPNTYVLVEKILGSGEHLPADWKTHGTTGYDFLNQVNSVLIDPGGYGSLAALYARFTGLNEPRLETFRARKRQVMRELFGSEVAALSNRLAGLAQSHRCARDLTRQEIEEALVAVTASLPVYRTYIRDFVISESDRAHIEGALAGAGCQPLCPGLEFLREVLLLEPQYYQVDRLQDYLDFVLRWQQFTGPVMAKGLEDTTFYVQNTLISLNEVGGDGISPESLFGIDNFHQRNVDRLCREPSTMNAGSTHDTKRSEDVRTRIDVLSEIADEWEDCLIHWSRWNACPAVPDANEQTLIYQTLLGVWPISPKRLHGYLIKALREAKTHTNWLQPDEEYERHVLEFVDRILEPKRSGRFLRSFLKLQRKIAYFGGINSLSQTLLKIMSPGVPDFYQGTELWDWTLADPDNRHPIDFESRKGRLERLKKHTTPADLLENWNDGGIKMFLIRQALRFRRENADLLLAGDYLPLRTSGKHAENIIAFARRHEQRWAITAVPRLTSKITRPNQPPLGSKWSDTALEPPPGCPNVLRDIFTGKTVQSMAAAAIFSDLPFSVLEYSSL